MSDEVLFSWDLDILTLNSTELMQTAAAVFRQSHVLQTFGIGAETLAHFLAAIGTRCAPQIVTGDWIRMLCGLLG